MLEQKGVGVKAEGKSGDAEEGVGALEDVEDFVGVEHAEGLEEALYAFEASGEIKNDVIPLFSVVLNCFAAGLG